MRLNLEIWTLIVIVMVPIFLYAREASQVVVRVEGVAGKELDNVRVAVSPPEGLVRDGQINEKWMEHFKKQVPGKAAKVLEPFGYYNAKVTVSSDVTPDGVYRLNILVEPGEPILVKDVTVEVKGPGSAEPELLEVVREFPIHGGERLRQDVYEQAKDAILSKAAELGYLEADYVKHEIRIDTAASSAQIWLILQTGELHHFGQISFSGAPNYPPSFLGRFIVFKPGDVYSDRKIRETQKSFIDADRFRSVMISADKDKAVDHVVPVEIRLQESKPKRLRMGVGYETDTGPKGSLKYEDVNFAKTGHRFLAQFDLSVPVLDAGVRYIVPHPKDTRSFSALSFNIKREDYRGTPDYLNPSNPHYFNEVLTAEYERAHSLGKVGTGSVFLQLLKERSDVGEDHTDSFSAIPGLRLSTIHYDDMVRPQRGYRYLFEVKGTHQAIGSTTGFAQFIADAGLIIPLPAGLRLLARAKIGATMQNERAAELPVALRFFAGGDKSIRGYSYKSLGPTDAEGDVIGGKNTLVGSIELEKAVAKDWGVAAFFDAGNAFNDFGNVNMAQGAGIGGRYYSPIGPIRLDIARQLNQPRPDIRIHISIGFGL